ncbi:efflux RND transporter permease subunit [Candidatus Tisiphia endosymbiont of Beris chalybata]|uniref:efflux RND transporter permease subunit n=1 Tax=Candidatus Tisiphia endosymbiont of Beris chalybata TaxID=3066262 RepID=UPI00312CAB1C
MLLSEICITRPVFATVLSLIIMILGAISFTKLDIRGTPDISFPVITINAEYPGADARYMEQEVTTRLEKVLKTVKNIDYITSESTTGSSVINLTFLLSTDIELALNDVRSKISNINYLLPQDMKLPNVTKMNSDNFPALFLSINSDIYDDLTLTKIVEDIVKTPLEKLETIGQVNVYGGKYYSMRIEPDPVKLYEYKMSVLEIENALKKQNKYYPAGFIQTNTHDFIVRLDASLSKPEEFAKIILKKQGSTIIKLQDIAKIYLAPPDPQIIFRYNGKSAIALGLIKQSKANILKLSKEVKEALGTIKGNLPAGTVIDIAYDGSVPVDASIKSVFHTILEALILVILVIYLFLGSVPITIIPLVTVPVSLIGTFSAMYYLGFSINIFTLLAMILAIGLVVDDAIVMLENIFRYNKMGYHARESALLASKEIGFAIIAMTITLASVFLPIAFIDGFIGKLFIEFAWTLAFCVLLSGFVALTLTPMMASKMCNEQNTKTTLNFLIKFEQIIKLTQEKYLYYLDLTFKNKKYFIFIIVLSLVILCFSLMFIPKIFVPQEDDGFLQLSFTGPEGSSLNKTDKTVIETATILNSYPDILGYLTISGGGGNDRAFGFILLQDWGKRTMSQNAIKEELNKQFAHITGMTIFAMNPRSLVSGNAKSPIEFTLQTSLEYEELGALTQQFVNSMKKNPVFMNINSDLKSFSPTIEIIVDRDKAYLYGASLENIGSTLQYLIAGKQIGDFRMGNNLYDVTLQYSLKHRSSKNDFNKILIPTNEPNNSLLPLNAVARLRETVSIKSYNHYNNSRSVTITADLAQGQKIKDAVTEINKIADKLLDKSTTILQYIGEIKQMKESNSNIISTFLFALLFIYLVLSAQFESFTDPILILVAVPFSITGGVVTLFLSGNSLNMYSNIGLITLIGLVTKNSIMLVEFANQLRKKGMNIMDAIMQAASLRLRPILMTSLATIFGAISLVISSGAGAAAQHSIGLVIIGGMSIGTIFTLFVIPVLYQTFKKESINL